MRSRWIKTKHPRATRKHEDPLAARNPEKYGGLWLAAIEPVFIRVGAEERDTGWVVIVQGAKEDALGWVDGTIAKLKQGLLWRSLIGLTGVLIVVTALSSLVVRALDRASRARLAGGPRRGGLAADTASLGSQTGLSSLARAPGSTPAAGNGTQTKEQLSGHKHETSGGGSALSSWHVSRFRRDWLSSFFWHEHPYKRWMLPLIPRKGEGTRAQGPEPRFASPAAH